MLAETIILASSNAGKIREFNKLFENTDIPLKLQSEFSITDAEETALTFVENALIKARHAASITGLRSIADDSGIVIDALNGKPGVFSARYAGINKSSNACIEKVLSEMRHVPWQERTARFYGVIVFMRHAEDPIPIICEASWEGYILEKPSTSAGFGYDPIFYVPTHNCAASELAVEEKNRISHRGQALNKLFRSFSVL